MGGSLAGNAEENFQIMENAPSSTSRALQEDDRKMEENISKPTFPI
jgi:hypothetical protein